ncbi:hypothetical protein EPI10_015929 [Gossypium australe]|uniref:Uncharacterized protein n=1 Tax=Gossypium australe TaxID=47621 RepID=A0A5B6VM63_9ROSI|nr:hypothetical protein EPI10_015929 [Gossypium australe]
MIPRVFGYSHSHCLIMQLIVETFSSDKKLPILNNTKPNEIFMYQTKSPMIKAMKEENDDERFQ